MFVPNSYTENNQSARFQITMIPRTPMLKLFSYNLLLINCVKEKRKPFC